MEGLTIESTLFTSLVINYADPLRYRPSYSFHVRDVRTSSYLLTIDRAIERERERERETKKSPFVLNNRRTPG